MNETIKIELKFLKSRFETTLEYYIENEKELEQSLKECKERYDYQVTKRKNAENFLIEFEKEFPDLVEITATP